MIDIPLKQLKTLQDKYGSDRAIADLYGTSRQTIFQLRKKYNLPPAKSGKPKRNNRIKQLAENGISPIKLSIEFNLSIAQIYRIISKHKKRSVKKITPQVFSDVNKLSKTVEKLKKSGKTIVTTNGCFDILHSGHVQYLNEAASTGDILIVGINSDSSVKRLKGDSRPLQNEVDRATIIASLKAVDYSLIFEEDTPVQFLDIIRPDIHVKGGDYNLEDLPEAKVVQKYGGVVNLLSFKDGVSTTKIIEKM